MKTITIPVIENPQGGASCFVEESYSLDDYNGMFISQRQEALNFRHRSSEPGYFSPWHVAGDSTLIIIRQGRLRLSLRSGEYRDFSAGDQFIARDFLVADTEFDNALHGHTAEVLGDEALLAVHVKLEACKG